ncbi:MAG: CsoS2 family carboxysome shell protein [Granulosicoccaceae bacterium]
MAQTATNQTAREASLARRRAMSTRGKAALPGAAANQANSGGVAGTSQASQPPVASSSQGMIARDASRARREAMATRGKAGIQSKDRTREAPEQMQSAPPTATPAQTPGSSGGGTAKPDGGCGCGCNGTKKSCDGKPRAEMSLDTGKTIRPMPKQGRQLSPARAASLARREAMSNRGKAGLSGKGMSQAQTARAANPNLNSRELAKALREQRSKNGKSGQQKSRPSGRQRNKSTATGAAEDAPSKVGASETAHGQTVTGTMVGRSPDVTGDEPSTCRTVTGTEYMGADIFREFCQAEPGKPPSKVSVSPTSRGNRVTGNRVGRGKNVTGNEPGTCKRVTGNEYVGANQAESYCGSKAEAGPGKITSSQTRKGKTLTGSNVGRFGKVTGDETGADRELTGSQYMQTGNGKAPHKVGSSSTLRGGSITGTMVGRNERVTGDEPGSCRDVTGDDYIGQEQFGRFCEKTPEPQDRKVGLSATLEGKAVTGTMTGRSGRVTGDEPGTCKAVTGTPYAGAEQYAGFCKPDEANQAAARQQPRRGTPGAAMTGQQPGINGALTGAGKGACEDVSGTPYVGADQFAEVCPATAADSASPDFPQAIGGTPWGQFSVSSPAGEAQQQHAAGGVTGSRYEQGQITGPFGMASGKVTGTEEARFDQGSAKGNSQPAMPATAEMFEGRVKSRITGEGMDAGARITGDDWDRGDNVTGTEGMSATRRNPTLQGSGPISAMQPPKRNEEMTVPSSKVTGGSGNTEKGALVTYSGGARG